MNQPATFSDAITYLNSHAEAPQQLRGAMIEVLTSNLELAPTLIPSYARHLDGSDFDALSGAFPSLVALLNGYRQMNLAQAS